MSICLKKRRKERKLTRTDIETVLIELYLSCTGVDPSSLRYLCPRILRYCSIMSRTIVNWVNIKTRSSFSFISGQKSIKHLKLSALTQLMVSQTIVFNCLHNILRHEPVGVGFIVLWVD